MLTRKRNRFPVVCNSSPIINLCKVGLLRLLHEIYSEVVIPNAVLEELTSPQSPRSHVKDIAELVATETIKVRTVKNRALVQSLVQQIDFGEAEVIALALEAKASLAIIDEVDARRIAQIYEIPKIGFIGVLIEAQARGFIHSALEQIECAREKGFWINDGLYMKIKASLSNRSHR